MFFKIIVIVLSLLIFPTFAHAADNLLKNPGFEDGLVNWISTPSTATFAIVNDSVKSGSQSATITKTASSSFAYFYQRIPIEQSTYYQLSGNVVLNDPKIDTAKLRIYFLDEAQNKIQNIDATTQTHTPDWQLLKTDTIQSPANAISAEIEGYVNLSDKNPAIPAHFDELLFTKVDITPVPAQPSPTLSPVNTATPTPQPTSSLPQSYSNIYISEAMTYPNDGENEWVEIYNDNDSAVNLNNWYIDDEENGGSSPKLFSLTLLPHSYGIVDLSTAMFNNDGDSIRLLDANKNIIDNVDYSLSTKNKSWGKTILTEDTLCIQEPSKSLINNSCIVPTSTPAPTPTILPTKNSTSANTTHPTPAKINNVSKPSILALSKASNKDFASKSYPDSEIPMVLGVQTTNNEANMQSTIAKSLSVASFGMALLSIAYTATKVWMKLKFAPG